MKRPACADHGYVFGGFTLRHRPCPECGASVAVPELGEHVCDPERRLDFLMFQHREELGLLEDEYRAYLASAEGKFQLWYAERQRRRASG